MYCGISTGRIIKLRGISKTLIMENTFERIKTTIIKLGNSNFPKVDITFSTKIKLETVNTILILEENNNISRITMSFFPPHPSDYFAFHIEKDNQNFKLFAVTYETEISIYNFEKKQKIIKAFEKEIENLKK